MLQNGGFAGGSSGTDQDGVVEWPCDSRDDEGYFDDEGGLATVDSPQLVNPAFRYGAQKGQNLRAVGLTELRRLKRRSTFRHGAIFKRPYELLRTEGIT